MNSRLIRWSSLRNAVIGLLGLAVLLCVACGGSHGTGASATSGALTIREARIPAPLTGAEAALYFTVKNSGANADALQSVATGIAGMTMLHREVVQGATAGMQPVQSIAVPAHGQVAIQPGVYHVMLMDLQQPLKTGMTVPVVLHFTSGAAIPLNVPVTSYTAEAAAMTRQSAATGGMGGMDSVMKTAATPAR